MANHHYEKPVESSERAGADEGEIGMAATGEIGMPSGSLSSTFWLSRRFEL